MSRICCMNCARRTTQAGRTGFFCGLDPDMQVNRRMVCEAWTDGGRERRTHFVGAISVSGMTTEKKR